MCVHSSSEQQLGTVDTAHYTQQCEACQTIGCLRDMPQAIAVVYDYFYRLKQACESMDLCTVSFEIVLSLILINLVVKVLEDQILFV